MPAKLPGYKLEGVAKAWASEAELLGRLSSKRRLIESPDEEALKCCNKHISHNHRVVRPLLEAVAEQPNWELFHLDAVYAECLASMYAHRIGTAWYLKYIAA